MSTILYADDHHALRSVFAETLRTAGHTVLEAGTLADAEHLIERHRGETIDVLITEAVLTTTNGAEVAHRLHRLYPKMQVLYTSDEPARNLLAEGLLPNNAPFLQKPFDAEDLIAKVEQLAKAVGAGKGRAAPHRRTVKTLRAGSARPRE
ncbi:MAG TPA: response regulator [Bryobacteraceae bacterium]|nr:response regulator [Bryobacteraceae bacterium]